MTERIVMLIFGAIVYCSSLAFIAACIFISYPEQSKEIAIATVSFLYGTGMASVINYYWGSSRGSARKTDDISDMLKKDDCKEDPK